MKCKAAPVSLARRNEWRLPFAACEVVPRATK